MDSVLTFSVIMPISQDTRFLFQMSFGGWLVISTNEPGFFFKRRKKNGLSEDCKEIDASGESQTLYAESKTLPLTQEGNR